MSNSTLKTSARIYIEPSTPSTVMPPVYVICKHTCGERINPMTGMKLWPLEHGLVQRHATNQCTHRKCTRECPGFKYLCETSRREQNSDAIIIATEEQVNEMLPTPIDNRPPPIIPISNGTAFRTLNLLYVGDPANAARNRSLTKDDLGFIQGTIPIKDWNLIQDLNNTHVHIHPPGQDLEGCTHVKVYIQEWVWFFNAESLNITKNKFSF